MKTRKVDLSGLPRDKKGNICWLNSKGCVIPFVYDDVEGNMCLVNVYKNKYNHAVLDVEYKGKVTYAVPTSSIRECIVGRILGMKSFDFVTEIGQCFIDERRDYMVINQRRAPLKSNPNYTQRQVQILCRKCGEETWRAEERVLPPRSCACKKCINSPKSGKKSIVETDEWMIPYFEGGYEEAQMYTRGQGVKKNFICPYCKKKRDFPIAIATLAREHSIGCSCPWSKMSSFPQRLFKAMLDELKVNYIQECSNKELEWITSYRYDFYLPDVSVIVELHGKEHYEKGTGYFKDSLEKIQKNDIKKQMLAYDVGNILPSNYIVIDCRKSMTDFIKNNILKSKLKDILGKKIEMLDWLLLTERAWKSEKIEISRYINENPNESVRAIAENFGVSRDMVKEIQQNLGIYDSEKERNLGVVHQQELFEKRTEERDRIICKIKENNPALSCTELAKIIGMDRHSVVRILRRRGIYDAELEKNNRYNNISIARKKKREKDYEIVCKYKIDSPLISAREVAKRTGHGHGYVIRIWKENGLV